MISKDDAKSILEPYIKRIHDSIFNGWNAYKNGYDSVSHIHSPIARPLLIRDHILDYLRHAFDEDNRVEIIEKQNAFFMCIEWKLMLRFKKLDSNLKARNSKTHRSMAFDRQLTLFDGAPGDVVNITAGYVPDTTWSHIKGAHLVCPNGEKLEWSIPITENEFMSFDAPVFMLMPQDADDTEDVEIITLKNKLAREGEHGKSTGS